MTIYSHDSVVWVVSFKTTSDVILCRPDGDTVQLLVCKTHKKYTNKNSSSIPELVPQKWTQSTYSDIRFQQTRQDRLTDPSDSNNLSQPCCMDATKMHLKYQKSSNDLWILSRTEQFICCDYYRHPRVCLVGKIWLIREGRDVRGEKRKNKHQIWDQT